MASRALLRAEQRGAIRSSLAALVRVRRAAGRCSRSLTRCRWQQGGRRFGTSDGYLHRSKVPTMHYQASLPRLPIPKLEDSCNKYLYFLEPLVTPEQFQQSSKAVQEFLSGAGKDLHQELLAQDRANKHTSYINGALVAALRLAPCAPSPLAQACGSTCMCRIGGRCR